MKPYVKAKMEILKFETSDVLAFSGWIVDDCPGEGGGVCHADGGDLCWGEND